MPRKVITSWSTSTNGELIEHDLKLYANDEEQTYEIEAAKGSIGVVLGLDPNSKKYTVITKIPDIQRLERFLHIVSMGDILIAINERVVLDESFADIANILEVLISGGYSRRLKFMSCKNKAGLQSYMLKLELNHIGKVQPRDLLGFHCTIEEQLSEKYRHQINHPALIQRDLLWVDYLKSIGGAENLKPAGIFKPSIQLRELVRRGIPVAYRALVWSKISLASIYRHQAPDNYYQSLLLRIDEIDPRVREDIEKDVDRTFPEHVYFQNSGKGEDGLRHVLYAFAVHNPEIGYCQSLNFVAGMMLIFMDEEDAFWLLVTVVEKLLPPDYYTKSMVGTYVDQFVLAHIIKKFLPKIHSAFEANQLQLPLITVQWFMCIFVNTLRPEVTLRVWDMFLNEGSKVLFRIAAGLFKLNETKLLQVRDAGDLFTALRGIGKEITDPEILIAAAYKNYTPQTFSRSLPRPKSFGNAKNSSLLHRSTSFSSPKFGHKSQNRLVPTDLIGIGLAHIGPADAYDKYMQQVRTSSEFAIRGSELPSTSTTTTEQIQPLGVNTTALDESSYNHDQDIEMTTNPENINSVENSELTNELTTENIQSSSPEKDNNNKTNQALESPGSISKEIGGSLEVIDPVFADPALLLSRISESTMNSPKPHPQYPNSSLLRRESIMQNYGTRNPQFKVKKSDQRNRKYKNGMLNFYRADIAIWRSTFRPGLQERHEKMEISRSKYKSVGKNYNNSSSNVNSPIPTPISSPISSPVSKLPPQELEDFRPVDITRRTSTASALGQPEELLPIDEEAMMINYSIDHPIEVELTHHELNEPEDIEVPKQL